VLAVPDSPGRPERGHRRAMEAEALQPTEPSNHGEFVEREALMAHGLALHALGQKTAKSQRKRFVRHLCMWACLSVAGAIAAVSTLTGEDATTDQHGNMEYGAPKFVEDGTLQCDQAPPELVAAADSIRQFFSSLTLPQPLNKHSENRCLAGGEWCLISMSEGPLRMAPTAVVELQDVFDERMTQKTVFVHPDKQLVVKVANSEGLSWSVDAEYYLLQRFCRLGTAADRKRIPITFPPFDIRVSADGERTLKAVIQQRVHNPQTVRVGSGTNAVLYSMLLPNVIEHAALSRAAALRAATDWLGWSEFLGRVGAVEDLQFLVEARSGNVWLFDPLGLVARAELPALEVAQMERAGRRGELPRPRYERPLADGDASGAAYLLHRQRVATLSLALAAALAAEGQRTALEASICDASCELGCAFLGVPDVARAALANASHGTASSDTPLAHRVMAAMDALIAHSSEAHPSEAWPCSACHAASRSRAFGHGADDASCLTMGSNDMLSDELFVRCERDSIQRQPQASQELCATLQPVCNTSQACRQRMERLHKMSTTELEGDDWLQKVYGAALVSA